MVGETSGTGRRWPLWTALGLLAALALCIAPVSLGIMVLLSGPDARWTGVPCPRPRAPARPQPGRRRPDPGRRGWLRDRMSEALTQQAKALLAGDEKGFLAAVDPAAPAQPPCAGSTRPYGPADRQVGTGAVHQADPPGRRPWRALVASTTASRAPCIPTPVTIGTRWADTPAGVRLVAVEPRCRPRTGRARGRWISSTCGPASA